MEVDWGVIIYFLFLIDSLGAVMMSWFGRRWWLHHAGQMAHYFPPAKGWSLVYFLLIIYIGFLLGIL